MLRQLETGRQDVLNAVVKRSVDEDEEKPEIGLHVLEVHMPNEGRGDNLWTLEIVEG